MGEIIGVITKVEDDSYDNKAHKKVTLGTGQVLKVKYGKEGALKAKWGLLQEGVAIKFTMKDYTTPKGEKKTFVSDIEISDIETVESALPPAEEPLVLPQHQKVIDEAMATIPPKPTPEPAPQAVGMVTNNICQLIIADKLIAIFGKEIAIELVKWYHSQVLGITRIKFDGEKLPKFEAH